MYVGSEDGKLYAFEVGCNTGGGSCAPLWTGATGDGIWSSPAVANGLVYVGSRDGRLYAYAVGCNSGGGSCTPLWTGATGNWILSSPAVADGVIYVGSGDGRLYAFDLLHGDVTAPVITSAPRVAGAVPSTLGSGSTLISWKGSDGAGSGIVSYDLQQQKDGGAWTTVSRDTPAATSVTRALVFSHSYRYRVRANDRAGNVGAWSTGTAVVPELVQGSSLRVRYPLGAWHTQYTAKASGGSTRWSTSTHARATLTFTGRAVVWVASTRPRPRPRQRLGRRRPAGPGGPPHQPGPLEAGRLQRRLEQPGQPHDRAPQRAGGPAHRRRRLRRLQVAGAGRLAAGRHKGPARASHAHCGRL